MEEPWTRSGDASGLWIVAKSLKRRKVSRSWQVWTEKPERPAEPVQFIGAAGKTAVGPAG